MHKFGPARQFNCWLFALLMLTTGRAKKVRWVWKRWLEFPHVFAITRTGRVLHFTRTDGLPTRFGCWFRGRATLENPQMCSALWFACLSTGPLEWLRLKWCWLKNFAAARRRCVRGSDTLTYTQKLIGWSVRFALWPLTLYLLLYLSTEEDPFIV